MLYISVVNKMLPYHLAHHIHFYIGDCPLYIYTLPPNAYSSSIERKGCFVPSRAISTINPMWNIRVWLHPHPHNYPTPYHYLTPPISLPHTLTLTYPLSIFWRNDSLIEIASQWQPLLSYPSVWCLEIEAWETAVSDGEFGLEFLVIRNMNNTHRPLPPTHPHHSA